MKTFGNVFLRGVDMTFRSRRKPVQGNVQLPTFWQCARYYLRSHTPRCKSIVPESDSTIEDTLLVLF
jgi:hypothetical protein